MGIALFGNSHFKNASAFLLRDARHAMPDILLLRISASYPLLISLLRSSILSIVSLASSPISGVG